MTERNSFNFAQPIREGVGVMIVKGDKVLLGVRKGDDQGGTYSFPGGKIEDGEDAKACAIREVKEETGLDIKNPILYSWFTDTHPNKDQWHVKIFIAKAPIDQEPKNMEPDKCEGWKWHSVHDLPKPLFSSAHRVLIDEGAGVIDNVTWLLNRR
jgi:8-oxo-dGTP diphosphatase